MKSWRTEAFRRAFAALPKPIQRQARRAYEVFKGDPSHPSLQFKKVHPSRPIYSVRIGLGYRALGTKTGDDHLVLDRIPRRIQPTHVVDQGTA